MYLDDALTAEELAEANAEMRGSRPPARVTLRFPGFPPISCPGPVITAKEA